MAVGASRIARHHYGVAFLHALRGYLEDVLGAIGHVVLAEVRWLAVLADVGAIEAVIAGVSRPHPVVGVTAEFADTFGRRMHQAHVADFQLLDEVELEATVVVGHPAAMARILLARRNHGFLVAL